MADTLGKKRTDGQVWLRGSRHGRSIGSGCRRHRYECFAKAPMSSEEAMEYAKVRCHRYGSSSGRYLSADEVR